MGRVSIFFLKEWGERIILMWLVCLYAVRAVFEKHFSFCHNQITDLSYPARLDIILSDPAGCDIEVRDPTYI